MREKLENRLIDFTVSIISLCKNLNNEYVSNYLTNQIIRSSASSALNYGEAQAAESRKDFIHKCGIVLKELRESYVCLKIIYKANLLKKGAENKDVLNECNELISIFHKTIKTAKSNLSNNS